MLRRLRPTLMRSGLGLMAAWSLTAGAAFAVPPGDEDASRAAMQALGRGTTPVYLLGDIDLGAYCQQRYGTKEAGFDQASQRYYCKTRERWMPIVPIEACNAQFGNATFADAGTARCYRSGGEDPGERVAHTQSGPVHTIKPGTVDQAFTDGAAPVTDASTAGQLSAQQVAASGAAERVRTQSGPLQVWNRMPLFARIMIFGGGTLIVGLWAGGWAIRMMP